jgi:hypothetical protein
MKTLAFASWRGVTLTSFGSRPASPEDWASYLEMVRVTPRLRQRALVITQGATLENYQRKELEAVTGTGPVPDRRVAIVTDSTFVRGFVRALARGEPGFKAFTPAELDAALEYVKVPRGDWAECKGLLAMLAAQLAPS